MQSDASLIKQFLDGDEQAFHRLIIKYQADIYALTLSYMRNPEDAKELTQEVFFEAYKGISSLKQPESFCFWLRRIARNQYHIWQRKEKGNIVPLEDMISDAMPTDELMILRESFAKVMQVIDQLPETEKDILKSRYLEDASYEELQERYDLSYKALNMRLSRAKQKVRARVEKLLASINIFSWHDALEKMLLGGVEAVKISLKTKLIVAGIAIVMVSGGAGIFIWHSHQSATGSSETSVSQVTQNVHQQTPAKPVNAANTKVAVVDNIPKQETDKSKEDDLGKVKTDESSNSPTNANELGTDDRTPEQWEKYRLLTQLLPKYNELVDKRSKLQTEWEAEEPSKFPPPNDIPLEQQIAWVNQKEREFGEKWGKIRKEIPAEIAKIEEMLLESFPTAITRGPLSPERIAEIRKDAKIPDGFPFPTAPGTVVFDINRKELRKIVGGSLPMDKVKYVKVGDDWVPAD